MIERIMAGIRRWNIKTIKPFGSTQSTALRMSVGDQNMDVAQALASAFSGVDAVEVVSGNLLDLSCDAIVSPANSFGNMGGGIDKVIDDFHRGEAQSRVRRSIANEFLGELPVGMAIIVEIPANDWPFIVVAPTMRIPGSIAGSINAYLAMRATLVAIHRHNTTSNRKIRSLAVPGLGTGVGGLDYDDAAIQMRSAYDNVVGDGWQNIVIAAQAPFALRDRR